MAEPLRPTDAARRLPVRGFVLGALLAALLGFGRLLTAYFVGDDFAFVGRYAAFPFSAWPGLFTRSWQAGLFSVDLREIRPLNALAFMLDGRLWGAEPLGFRLTNLLLHAGCVALVGAIAWQISRARRVAALAALLFAFHPVTVPAVGWITGRVDVLSTLLVLGATLAWLRHRETATGGAPLIALALCFAGGLFTKESALVFPALALVLDFIVGGDPARWRRAGWWRPYLVLGGVLAVYLTCRFAAFGLAGPTGVGRGASAFDRTALAETLRRQARYLAHLFPPAAEWLVTWRDRGFPVRDGSFGRLLAWALAATGAIMATIRALRRGSSPGARPQMLGLAVGWYLVTTLPLIVTYFSARHLYLTWPGIAVALAVFAHDVLPSARRFWTIGMIAVAGLAGLQQMAAASWLHAAERSRALSAAIQAAARDAEPGTFVFVDAPELVGGAFCWSWAVPHCLRPPFTVTPLDTHVRLLARPAAYAYRETWRAHLPLAALAANDRPAFLLSWHAGEGVVVQTFSAAQVRSAAHVFAVWPRDDDEAWSAFVAELTAQRAAR